MLAAVIANDNTIPVPSMLSPPTFCKISCWEQLGASLSNALLELQSSCRSSWQGPDVMIGHKALHLKWIRSSLDTHHSMRSGDYTDPLWWNNIKISSANWPVEFGIRGTHKCARNHTYWGLNITEACNSKMVFKIWEYRVLHALFSNKIWWLWLAPTSTTRFATEVGYRMAKI